MAEGVHVIYTDGCKRLHKKLETLASDTLLDGGIEREIRALLSKLGEAKTNAGYVKTRHNLMLHDLERREALEAKAARGALRYPTLRITTGGGTAPTRRSVGSSTSWRTGRTTASTSTAPHAGKRACHRLSLACARCLQRTTGALRRPSRGGARRGRVGTRGAHRPSPRRSG